MAEVTYLDRLLPLPVPVARVLAGARDCTDVLVLGVTPAGERYVASSTTDATVLLWWLEKCKHALLSGECQ